MAFLDKLCDPIKLKVLQRGKRMNCIDKKGMGGKYSFFFKLPSVCMVALLILGGCRLPDLLRGDVENPHLKRECNVCHKAPDELLIRVEKGEGDEGDLEEAKALKSDLNGICTGCHEPGKGDHAIGEVPRINKRHLPLDSDGRITCALTCHNVHTKNIDDPRVKKRLLRLPQTDLCFSCHDT